MKIEKYISALLYRYQCVIIPGFGAFLTETKSSYYNEEEQAFFPPQKMMSFNANVKHNDGLLANHIAMQEKISYDEAVKYITLAVKGWDKELSNLGSLTLSTIGAFQCNSEGSLVFEPTSNSNYLMTSFGLSSVMVSSVDRVATIPLQETVAVPQLRKKSKYAFVKYAAVITLFLGVGSVIADKGYDAYLNDQSYTIEKNVQSKVQDKIQQATFIIEPSATTISIPVREEVIISTELAKPYHIVACAFRSKQASEEEAVKLQNKGFEGATALARTKYGMYPVSYGGFETQGDAQKELKKIHRSTNKDAWILVQ
ncbi:SPOR domain-containing protein [Myroides phaeus]|uniref:HU domain-containing protein n=1 Tax=Myroides phaeus TaxID=702745 RepID=UPI002DB73165|nr:SPOR domain-containing protein [Myroides phaeus]MEC4115805.1 SPOR domain-containing protein [Myroides phaeus]